MELIDVLQAADAGYGGDLARHFHPETGRQYRVSPADLHVPFDGQGVTIMHGDTLAAYIVSEIHEAYADDHTDVAR